MKHVIAILIVVWLTGCNNDVETAIPQAIPSSTPVVETDTELTSTPVIESPVYEEAVVVPTTPKKCAAYTGLQWMGSSHTQQQYTGVTVTEDCKIISQRCGQTWEFNQDDLQAVDKLPHFTHLNVRITTSNPLPGSVRCLYAAEQTCDVTFVTNRFDSVQSNRYYDRMVFSCAEWSNAFSADFYRLR